MSRADTPLLIYPAKQEPVLAEGDRGEAVTEDRWHQPLSQPVNDRLTTAAMFAACLAASSGPVVPPPFETIPVPEEVTVDKYHKPWSEPVIVAPGVHYATALAASSGETSPPSEPTIIYSDRWFSSFAEVMPPKAGLHASLQQQPVIDAFALTQAELVTIDRWLIGLSEPPHYLHPPRLLESLQQSLALNPLSIPDPETVTVDKWFQPFAEVPYARPRLIEALHQAFATDAKWDAPITVDPGNSINTNLAQCFIFGQGDGNVPIDIVPGNVQVLTAHGSLLDVEGPCGVIGTSFNGTTDYVDATANEDEAKIGTNDVSILIFARPANQSQNGHMFSYRNASSGFQHYIFSIATALDPDDYSASKKMSWTVHNGGPISDANSSALHSVDDVVAGDARVFGLVRAGTTDLMYLNGDQIAVNEARAATSAINPDNTNTNCRQSIGALWSGLNLYTGDIFLIRRWERQLTDAEWEALGINPYLGINGIDFDCSLLAREFQALSQPVFDRPTEAARFAAVLIATSGAVVPPPHETLQADVFADSWHVAWSEPLYAQHPIVQEGYVTPYFDFTEQIFADKWFNPWAEVMPALAGLNSSLQAAATIDAQALTEAEAVSIDKWLYPFSEPVWNLPPLPDYGGLVNQLSATLVVEIVTIDKWYRPLNEPVPPKAGLGAEHQQHSSVDTNLLTLPEATTIDKWFSPFSEPLYTHPPIVDLQGQVYELSAELAEVITVDKWFSHLSEPLHALPAIGAYQDPASTVDMWLLTQPEATSPDRWFIPLSEPLFDYVRLRDYGLYSRPEIEVVAEIVTVDKWFVELNRPVLPPARPPEFLFAFIGLETLGPAIEEDELPAPQPPVAAAHELHRWLVRTGHIDLFDESTIDDFRLTVKRGVGTNTSESVIMLRYRKDNKRWSRWVKRGLGKTGDRKTDVFFGPLGSATTWQFEIAVTDDCDVQMEGAAILYTRLGH